MNASLARLPIVDGHVHFVHPEKMDEMLALLDTVPCDRFHLVCVPNPDASTHNPAALHFKRHHPGRAYISAALDYSVLADPEHAPQRLAAQIGMLKQQGFDGLKLIEGKPQVRNLLPHPLDGPLYAGVWAALEREEFPVVFHVNDPDEFWDPVLCPDWARQSGWDYSDGSFPSKESLYAEVDHILARHPRLKITFAHFYFLSRDLERAGRFLDAHPGVCFDLAPHMEMYRDFSRDPEAARAFFVRYQERIVYGTDIDTRVLVRGPQGQRFLQSIPLLIRSFLETAGQFSMPTGDTYHGIGLPQEALARIYAANFERIYSTQPAPLEA
jgi:predicted TIM-barrel fold metal-dependent hydrolase